MLFGAVARARCAATVQTLLDAGADPNDGESLYHATELTECRILAALVAAGARWAGTNALMRQLDHDDLAGLKQALALGAEPNETGPGGATPLQGALLRGRSVAFVQALVEHGANPAAVDWHGRSVAALAARVGDALVLAYLAKLGVAPQLQGGDAFLCACASGDAQAARAYLEAHPDAVAKLDAASLRLLPDQARRGRIDAVELMLELGWPVAVPGKWQASALNQAEFRGDAAMVRLLIAHGANWQERNGYGGTAVGSCLHAAVNEPVPGGDYADVLAQLLAQGAPAPANEANLPDALQDVVDAAVGGRSSGVGAGPTGFGG